MDVPELTKRELEWDAYKEWKSKQANSHILPFFHGEILLPRHAVLSIFACMGHNSQTLATFSASQDLYFALLESWKMLHVRHTNWNLIPTLVFYSTAGIILHCRAYCTGHEFFPPHRTVKRHYAVDMRIALDRLCDALNHNHTLTFLNLATIQLCGSEVEKISAALSNCRSINKFILIGSKTEKSGIWKMVDALRNNKTMDSLILSHNYIGDEYGEKIVKTLANFDLLTTLVLTDNHIGSRTGDEIASFLEWNKSITSLELTWNCLTGPNIEKIADTLKRNSTLASLHLDGNNIGDHGAEMIAAALMVNQKLTHVRLGNNNICDRGASAIFRALAQNLASGLKCLFIGNNIIGNNSATTIATAIGNNSTLTILSLRGTRFSISGTTTILAALWKNRTLTNLTITGSEVHDDAADGISTMLKMNSGLKCRVFLSERQIKDAL